MRKLLDRWKYENPDYENNKRLFRFITYPEKIQDLNIFKNVHKLNIFNGYGDIEYTVEIYFKGNVNKYLSISSNISDINNTGDIFTLSIDPTGCNTSKDTHINEDLLVKVLTDTTDFNNFVLPDNIICVLAENDKVICYPWNYTIGGNI
jgi:hypothetical protein